MTHERLVSWKLRTNSARAIRESLEEEADLELDLTLWLGFRCVEMGESGEGTQNKLISALLTFCNVKDK